MVCTRCAGPCTSLGLAKLYSAKEDAKQAKRELDLALELEPKNAEALALTKNVP